MTRDESIQVYEVFAVKRSIPLCLLIAFVITLLFSVFGSALDTKQGGTVNFYSAPSGAKVYVDGVYAGVTPLVLPFVAPGGRDIKMALEGYWDWHGMAGVPEGGVTTVAAYMIPSLFTQVPTNIGPTGMIIVITEPYGGTVYLDGRFKGTAPTTIENVRVGEHNIDVTYPAKPKYSAKVIVQSGIPAQVRVNLTGGNMYAEPTPATNTSSLGTVLVSSSPDRTSVFLNDEYYGITPLVLTLQKGEYGISLVKKDYNFWETAVRVIPNKTITIDAKMVRSSPPVTSLPVVTPILVKNKTSQK